MSNPNTFANAKKYLYSQGEQIYDIYRKKKGTIVCLRDDSREKAMRASNPSHYYYHVNYEDGSFDTYVSYGDFIPLKELELTEHDFIDSFEPSDSMESSSDNNELKPNLNSFLVQSVQSEQDDADSGQQFFPGQKFRFVPNGKIGTIRYLRDDSYEKDARTSDPTHYYYHVDFDDGSFETYMYGKNLSHI